MSVKKDNLFFVANTALKKERKYSLLFIRVYFIFFLLKNIIIFIQAFRSQVLDQSLGGEDIFCSSNVELSLALFIALSFFFLRTLWKLQFWGNYILGGISTISSFYEFLNNEIDYPILLLIILALDITFIISSCRVHMFLRNQKKERATSSTIIHQDPESFIK